MSAVMSDRTLKAPLRLVIDTRSQFRDAAVRRLVELPDDEPRLVIDMAGMREIDTTGLNVLMLIQRRAASLRKRVRLQEADPQIRSILELARLADLFEFDDPDSSA